MDSQEDTITLREFILLLQDYIQYFWSRKWLIILGAILGATYYGFQRFSAPATYHAELTFMLNEEDKGSFNGVGSILGQLGIDSGRGSGFNLAKIKELSRSRRIVQGVIFDSIAIDSNSDLVANHIIDVYDYWDKWSDEGPELRNFKFSHSTTDSFNRVENDVMKSLYWRVIGNQADGISGLVSMDYKDESGIVSIAGKTTMEELSIALSRKLYDKLSDFYVAKTTERQIKTLDRLNETADSVLTELRSVEYRLAQFRDQTASVVLRRNKTVEYDLLRQQQALNAMYAEVVRNKETSIFLLNTKTPNFQVIDTPIVPIYPSSKRIVRGALTGGVLGGLALVILFLILRVYNRTMRG